MICNDFCVEDPEGNFCVYIPSGKGYPGGRSRLENKLLCTALFHHAVILACIPVEGISSMSSTNPRNLSSGCLPPLTPFIDLNYIQTYILPFYENV